MCLKRSLILRRLASLSLPLETLLIPGRYSVPAVISSIELGVSSPLSDDVPFPTRSESGPACSPNPVATTPGAAYLLSVSVPLLESSSSSAKDETDASACVL